MRRTIMHLRLSKQRRFYQRVKTRGTAPAEPAVAEAAPAEPAVAEAAPEEPAVAEAEPSYHRLQPNRHRLVFMWHTETQRFSLHGNWPTFFNEGRLYDTVFKLATKKAKDEFNKLRKGKSKRYKNYNFNPSAELKKRMENIWYAKGAKAFKEFWEHEWVYHGALTNLACNYYFERTLAAAEDIINEINEAVAGLNLQPGVESSTSALEQAIQAALNRKEAAKRRPHQDITVAVRIDERTGRLKDVVTLHTWKAFALVPHPVEARPDTFIP